MAKFETKRIDQIAMLAAIWKELERQGITHLDQGAMNVTVEAADRLVAELQRERSYPGAGAGLTDWLAGDDTGMSSLFMAKVLCGAKVRDRGASYPLDPDDFGRCYRFTLAVPGTRERISEMAATHPVWAAYAKHWDEMERLFLEESPTRRAPKLYALMQSLRQQAKAA